MAKTTPKVRHKQLYLPGQAQPFCQLDSPQWFTWLETATTFRYFSQDAIVTSHYTRPKAPISVRKEKRRRGYLWYAYRRHLGLLHKRYVGRTRDLTVSRLDEIATSLDAVW